MKLLKCIPVTEPKPGIPALKHGYRPCRTSVRYPYEGGRIQQGELYHYLGLCDFAELGHVKLNQGSQGRKVSSGISVFCLFFPGCI